MQAKKAKHKEMITKMDDQHKFQTSITRWRKISTTMMKVGCSSHVPNDPACKDKWSMISSNFKKIFDLMTGTRQNQDYWAMNAQEKNKVQLSCNFKRGMYEMINELLYKQPIFQPLRTRDLMVDGNGIFKLARETPLNSMITKLHQSLECDMQIWMFQQIRFIHITLMRHGCMSNHNLLS